MASRKTLFLLFGILFCISTIAYAQSDKVLIDVEEDFSSLKNDRRRLQSSSNFRIHVNFDNLRSGPSSFTDYIETRMIPQAVSWFQGALQVKYPITGLLQHTDTVCGFNPTDELRNGVNADYYMMAVYKNENTNNVATGTACAFASGSKRPIVATVAFNTQNFDTANGDILVQERYIIMLIHEMMHTFGFVIDLFSSFLDENGNTRTGHVKTVNLLGSRRTVFDVDFLTEKARNHFGCSSLPGLYMEDDGGAGTEGSHLEKKFFLTDVMTSGTYYGRRISEFSLGILEASGWYDVNYDYAEPFSWGQGEGCNFFNQQCSSSNSIFEEFCTGESQGCSQVGRSGGNCYGNDPLSDGCKYQLPNLDYDCENPAGADYARLPDLQVFGRGLGSKCFEGTLNNRNSNSLTSFCFKFTCTGSDSNTQLQVQVGSDTITCQSEGPMLMNGYYGAINCPDPVNFCNTVGMPYCPRNCLNRGSCVNNKCHCDSGFAGIDCALNA